MYDPVGGRFVSRDPIGYGGSPWSLYEFLDGQPFNFVDPSGEAIKGLCKAICKLVWKPKTYKTIERQMIFPKDPVIKSGEQILSRYQEGTIAMYKVKTASGKIRIIKLDMIVAGTAVTKTILLLLWDCTPNSDLPFMPEDPLKPLDPLFE
jgi:hypothetical protein